MVRRQHALKNGIVGNKTKPVEIISVRIRLCGKEKSEEVEGGGGARDLGLLGFTKNKLYREYRDPKMAMCNMKRIHVQQTKRHFFVKDAKNNEQLRDDEELQCKYSNNLSLPMFLWVKSNLVLNQYRIT